MCGTGRQVKLSSSRMRGGNGLFPQDMRSGAKGSQGCLLALLVTVAAGLLLSVHIPLDYVDGSIWK